MLQRAIPWVILALLLVPQGTAQPAPPEEWVVQLPTGPITVQEGTVYEVIRKKLQPLRGEIIAANRTMLKLAVSTSADGVDRDVVYLSLSNIDEIRERSEATLQVRANPPPEVIDPYDLEARGITTEPDEETPETTEPGPETPPSTEGPPDSSGVLGEVDPAMAEQVDALLVRIAPPASVDPSPEEIAASVQATRNATQDLYALGAAATPALAARLPSSTNLQLEALSTALLRLNETRAIDTIISEYVRRGIYPPETLLGLFAASGMPRAIAWLTQLAMDENVPESRRVACCTSLQQASPDASIAETMRELVISSPRDSAVPLAALDCFGYHADDPISGYLDFLSRDLTYLDSVLLPELASSDADGLDQRLQDLYEAGTSTATTRQSILRILARRAGQGPLPDGLQRWFVEQLGRSRDLETRALALESLVATGLPGQQDGTVDYEELVLESLRPDGGTRILTAALDAVHLLETDVSLEICEALLVLWRELEAYSPDERRDRNLEPVLDRIPRLARRITGQAITRPEALEAWLDQQ